MFHLIKLFIKWDVTHIVIKRGRKFQHRSKYFGYSRNW